MTSKWFNTMKNKSTGRCFAIFFLKKKKKRIRNELNAIIGAKSIVWGSNFVKVEYLRIASAYKKIIKLHKETRVMQMQIWFLFLKLFWLTLRKIVLVIKKNFSHLRLKVEINHFWTVRGQYVFWNGLLF